MVKDKITMEISIKELSENYLNVLDRIKISEEIIATAKTKKKEIEELAKKNDFKLPKTRAELEA